MLKANVARHGAQALREMTQTRSGYVLSIVIVAVVGLVALCLLAVALQPSHATRDNLSQGSISQNFPRAHGGPYARQGVYVAPDSYKSVTYQVPYGMGVADARPSFRDSFQP